MNRLQHHPSFHLFLNRRVFSSIRIFYKFYGKFRGKKSQTQIVDYTFLT